MTDVAKFELAMALIERRVMGMQEDGASVHAIHEMICAEVDCAERCYPGFIAWAEKTDADIVYFA